MDKYGRTPVHYACEKNYFFSILYLLDKNIDINIQDNEGNTPLAICLISKNLNQAALLLKKGTAMGYVN
jgi:ankyrin repeat protein